MFRPPDDRAMEVLFFLLIVILLFIAFAWFTREMPVHSLTLQDWEARGREMAKVPTPPEHLNPPGSSYGPIPIERLKGDCDEDDTFWELCYLTRNDSEAQFRHETRAYMYLESAKDDAIIYKKHPTFYRQIRICQRLKSDEFCEE